MVSDQNKKTLIRTLEEHGRLHFNGFYDKVKSKMARQTFATALAELVEQKKVEKEVVCKIGGKQKYSYYVLPKIREIELSEINQLKGKYLTIYELLDAIINDKFVLPQVGKKNREFTNRKELIIESKKEIELFKREYVISILSEIILKQLSLLSMGVLIPAPLHRDVAPGYERNPKDLPEIALLDEGINTRLQALFNLYKITNIELFVSLKQGLDIGFEDLAEFLDTEAPKEWHVKLNFNADKVFSRYKHKIEYDDQITEIIIN